MAAVGWQRDPAFTGNFVADEVIQAGGRMVDMSKRWSFRVIPKMPWMFMQSTNSSDYEFAQSAGTLRSQFAGQLNTVWWDTTNLWVRRTGTATNEADVITGYLYVSWAIDARYPLDPDEVRPQVTLQQRLDAVQMFTQQKARKARKSSALSLVLEEKESKDKDSDSPVLVCSTPPRGVAPFLVSCEEDVKEMDSTSEKGRRSLANTEVLTSKVVDSRVRTFGQPPPTVGGKVLKTIL
jgi:hypothetical protein